MSVEHTASTIIRLIRSIVNEPKADTMLYGVVKSVDPISVEIASNVVLDERQLFLGQMVRPHKVTIPHTHIYNGETEKATATGDGDLRFSGNGNLVEAMGHPHKIKEQETEDVHAKDCGTDYEESVTIEIYPKLQEGDVVLMFAMNNYQKYYIAERIEEE